MEEAESLMGVEEACQDLGYVLNQFGVDMKEEERMEVDRGGKVKGLENERGRVTLGKHLVCVKLMKFCQELSDM